VRVCIIAAIMMVVGRMMEKLLQRETFDHLATVQQEARAAVESISPIQFKDRYVCALTPSVEESKREIESHGRGSAVYLGDFVVANDCKYTLSEFPARPTASSDSLRAPVVGHWADGLSGLVSPIVALFDTAWHLVIQPSFFASVFAVSAFLIAAFVVGLLMASANITWHPYAGPAIFAIATIAVACVVAACLKITMEGGLYLFGRFTSIAGLCCSSAGLAATGYAFFLKTIEVRVHEGVDEIIPH
jgi:hypothetical protein